MSRIEINKAPEAYVVVPCYVTAALFFVLASILLGITGKEILGHYFQPKVLAIVHTLALGWGSMIILGAAYQLVPVIFGKKLFSPPMAFGSYLLLMMGSLLLIYCFWHFKTDHWMIIAGSLVCLSSYLYFLNLWMTIKDVSHGFELNLFFSFSAFWFCFTTTIGLLLAINLYHGFLSKNHLDILKLHAHAGIVGWFLQLILGAGAKMLPMFLLGKSNKTRFLYAAVVLINLGLCAFLADGYLNSVGLNSLWSASLIFLGFISWAIYILDCIKNRARKKIDIPMKHALLSFICLLMAFAMLPIVVQTPAGNVISLYAFLIFMGWITGIVLGMTFKTLPFIIWNLKFKDLNGKEKIPMPKDMYTQQLLKGQFFLFIGNLLLSLLGISLKISWLLEGATYLWTLLSILYLWNVLMVVFYKRRRSDAD